MIQTRIETFFGKPSDDPEDPDSEFFDPDVEHRDQDVGQWTRVKALASMKTTTVQAYDLALDLASDNMLGIVKGHLLQAKGECIWDPQQYDGKQYNFSIERHRLSQEELQAFGIMATQIRSRFSIDPEQIEAVQAASMNPR